jgi:hypothetical protein
MDAIPERVKASRRRPLGRQVQLDLEFSDFVLPGVVGPLGHAPVLPSSSSMDEAEPLPSPEVVLSAGLRAVLRAPRHPAGRTRLRQRLIRAHRFPDEQPQARGRRGLPHFPHRPFRPCRSLYPGGFMTAANQDLHGVHGLRLDFPGSAPPYPLTGLASRGGRIHVTLRPGPSLPPKGLSTLGFDAGRFPPTPPACYPAPWHLPGPDLHRHGRCELMFESGSTSLASPHSERWAHESGG